MSQVRILIFLFVATMAPSDTSSNVISRHFEIIEASTNYQHQILKYISNVFCQIKTIFMNISIEKRVPFAFVYEAIRTLSSCSFAGIILNG